MKYKGAQTHHIKHSPFCPSIYTWHSYALQTRNNCGDQEFGGTVLRNMQILVCGI